MPTVLEQKRGRLAEVNGKMARMFDEKPDLSFTTEELGDIKVLDAECKTLGTEIDELVSAEATLQEAKKRAADLQAVQTRVPFQSPAATEEQQHITAAAVGHPGLQQVAKRRTIGQWFLSTPGFKQYDKGKKAGQTMESSWDALAGVAVDPDDVPPSVRECKALVMSGVTVPRSERIGVTVPTVNRQRFLVDIIPDGQTASASISYMEEGGFVNAATAIAEGAAYPESAISGFTEKTEPVRKIGTLIPLTEEMLNDEPQMRAFIDNRLRLMMELAEEAQLLNGSGIAPNVLGLMNRAGLQTQPKGTDPTPDAFHKAITKVSVTGGLPVDAIVMHPFDWEKIRLLRTPDGVYIWGNPSEAEGDPRLWGFGVIASTGATEGTGLVGAFRTASQLFWRQAFEMEISTEHGNNWANDILALKVRERVALAVYRPAAFCTVTGINVV